jgi:hypothetical protein
LLLIAIRIDESADGLSRATLSVAQIRVGGIANLGRCSGDAIIKRMELRIPDLRR